MSEDTAAKARSGLREARLAFLGREVEQLRRSLDRLAVGGATAAQQFVERLQHLQRLTEWLDAAEASGQRGTEVELQRCRYDLAALAARADVDPGPFVAAGGAGTLLEMVRPAESLVERLLQARSPELPALRRTLMTLCASVTDATVWPLDHVVPVADLRGKVATFSIDGNHLDLVLDPRFPFEVQVELVGRDGEPRVHPLRVRQRAISHAGKKGVARLEWPCCGPVAGLWRALAECAEGLAAQIEAAEALGEVERAQRDWVQLALRSGSPAEFADLGFQVIERLAQQDAEDLEGLIDSSIPAKHRRDVAKSIAAALPDHIRILDRAVLVQMPDEERARSTHFPSWQIDTKNRLGSLSRFISLGFQLLDDRNAVVRVVPAVATRSAGPGPQQGAALEGLLINLRCLDEARFAGRCRGWNQRVERRYVATLQTGLAQRPSDLHGAFTAALAAGEEELVAVLVEVLSDVEAVLHDAALDESERVELRRIQVQIWQLGDGMGPDRLQFLRPTRETFLTRAELQSDELEFEAVYHDTAPFGQRIAILRSGVRCAGALQSKGLVQISLGPKPALVQGVETFRAEFGVPPFDDELQEVLRLQRELPLAPDDQQIDALRAALVDRVQSSVLRMQQLEAVQQRLGPHAQDPDNPLRPFLEFLEYGDRLAFPGEARWHDRYPGVPRWQPDDTAREENAAFFEVREDWSPVRQRGHIIRVERFGLFDRRSGQLIAPARILVSRGEHFALGEKVDELRAEFAGMGGAVAGLTAALDRIRDIGAERDRARRELQEVDEGDAEHDRLQERLTAVEDKLAQAVIAAVGTLDGARESVDAEGAQLLEEGADKLLAETAEVLGLRSFPRVGRRVPAAEITSRNYERIESDWSTLEGAGYVEEVLVRGLVRHGEVRRRAIVRMSRGPKPAFVEYLDRMAQVVTGQAGNDALADELRALQDEVAELWRRHPVPDSVAHDRLAREAVGFGMRLEAWCREAGRDQLLESVREAFDGVATAFADRFPGLRRFGRKGEALPVSDLPAGMQVRWQRSDTPRGTVLEVLQAGVTWDGTDSEPGGPLVPAFLLVSSGPGAASLLEIERWHRLLVERGEAPAVRSDLEQMIQAVQAAGVDADPAEHIDPDTLAGSLAVLDELGLATAAAGVPAEQPSLGELGQLLVRRGWRRFPEGQWVDAAQLASAEFRGSTGAFLDGAEPYSVTAYRHFGWKRPDGVTAVAAHVVWSRGPAGFLGDVLHGALFEEAAAERSELMLYREREALGPDQTGVVPSRDAALVHCAVLHELLGTGSAPAATALRQRLEAVFRDHDATLFPRPGAAFELPPGADASAADVTYEHSTEVPAGHLLKIERVGLAVPGEHGLRVLRSASCAVSRGPRTPLDDMLDAEFEQYREALIRSDAGAVAEAILQVNHAQKRAESVVGPLERLWSESAAVVARDGANEPSLDASLRAWLLRIEESCREQLTAHGYRFEPAVGDDIDRLAPEWIGNRRDWFRPEARAGEILAVRRHAMLAPDGRMPALADVVVCVAEPTPAFGLLDELRTELLNHYDAQHPTVRELEESMQRALGASGTPYQEVMAAMGVLYQHKTAHGFSSRALFRGLRQRVQQFLDGFDVREFIREGDTRQLIDKETGRIRVRNAEDLTAIPDCIVQSIIKPGFERNGQTIQDAVITVGPRSRA